MSLTITYYFKLLRELLSKFKESSGSSKLILSSDELFTIYQLQSTFISPLLRVLLNNWMEGVTHEGENMLTIRLSIMIAFIFILALAFVFVWQPFLSYMRETVIQCQIIAGRSSRRG